MTSAVDPSPVLLVSSPSYNEKELKENKAVKEDLPTIAACKDSSKLSEEEKIKRKKEKQKEYRMRNLAKANQQRLLNIQCREKLANLHETYEKELKDLREKHMTVLSGINIPSELEKLAASKLTLQNKDKLEVANPMEETDKKKPILKKEKVVIEKAPPKKKGKKIVYVESSESEESSGGEGEESIAEEDAFSEEEEEDDQKFRHRHKVPHRNFKPKEDYRTPRPPPMNQYPISFSSYQRPKNMYR